MDPASSPLPAPGAVDLWHVDSASSPLPAPGAVDVWHVDLARARANPERLLSPEERARAARIVRAPNRHQWMRSRGALRALLGRCLDMDAGQLRFVLGPYGKPALAPDILASAGPGGPLRFNLSHSGELMLVAVALGRELGVDVERVRPPHTADRLRAWTMREAVVKCLGTGLAEPGHGRSGAGLWTVALDMGPRARAGLAVENIQPCAVRRRTWSG